MNRRPGYKRERNWLLRLIEQSAPGRSALQVETINVAQGAVLSAHGGRLSHVYFPSSCVLSLLAVADSGVAVETAMIGREGAFGLLVDPSSGETFAQCTVQVPGQTQRVLLQQFARLFDSKSSVRSLSMRANQVLMALGSDRTTVNIAARSLQRSGLIRYRRGAITVENRAAFFINALIDRLLRANTELGLTLFVIEHNTTCAPSWRWRARSTVCPC
jgi:hypothetical protein